MQYFTSVNNGDQNARKITLEWGTRAWWLSKRRLKEEEGCPNGNGWPKWVGLGNTV